MALTLFVAIFLCWIYSFTFSCHFLSISLTFHSNLIHVLHLIASYTSTHTKSTKKMNFIWWKMQSQTNRQSGRQSQSDYCCFLLLDNRKVLKKMNKIKSLGMAVIFMWHIIYTAQTWMNWMELSDKSFQFICMQENVIELKMMSHIRSDP